MSGSIGVIPTLLLRFGWADLVGTTKRLPPHEQTQQLHDDEHQENRISLDCVTLTLRAAAALACLSWG